MMDKAPEKISRRTVETVAKLARLKLTDAELNSLKNELSVVLENFEGIAAVDTAGIKPLVTPTEMTVQFRPDVVGVDANPDALLEVSTQRIGQLYKVPPVV